MSVSRSDRCVFLSTSVTGYLGANAATNNRCFHCTTNNSLLIGRKTKSWKREEANGELIPWEIVCEVVKWIEVAQDRVKVRIFSEPVCFATRMLFKCKADLRESVCEDGRCMELAQDLVR